MGLASLPDTFRPAPDGHSRDGGSGFQNHGRHFRGTGRRPALSETLQDAEMFSRAAHAQTVALRHGKPAQSLAVAHAQSGTEISKMAGGIRIRLRGMGHVHPAPANRKCDRAPGRPTHHHIARRSCARGVEPRTRLNYFTGGTPDGFSTVASTSTTPGFG